MWAEEEARKDEGEVENGILYVNHSDMILTHNSSGIEVERASVEKQPLPYPTPYHTILPLKTLAFLFHNI